MTPADRIRELLAEEAAGGRLDDAEFAELAELLDALPAAERQRARRAMAETAALGQAAFLAHDRAAWRRMPEDLRLRLSAMGRSRAPDPAPRRVNWPARWGWAAATAMVLAWIVTAVLLPPPASIPDSAAVQSAPDLVTYSWRSEFSEYEEVQGGIVWSDSLQAGEMRFAGLPPNDPAEQQYQLWIVDPDRFEQPVDGGVFDASPDGEFVVPIDAKLMVEGPVAFAVTLEQRGGVVVSDGPLLLVASTGERPNES